MVDARFELNSRPTTHGLSTTPFVKGISPLGYWEKVNQSPTQLSLITLSPPLNSGILGLRMGPYVPTPKFFYNLWGPKEINQILDMRKFTFL